MGERDIQISISGKLDVIETKKNITKDLNIIYYTKYKQKVKK
jgi:hypothetical protein